MNVRDIRHRNLVALGDRHRTWAALSRALRGEVSANYLSQLNNRTREMGDDVARRMEQALGLSDGYMDTLHEEDGASVGTGTESTLGNYTLVPRYNITAGMGPGEWFRSEQIIDELAFKTAWLRTRGLQPDKVAVIACRGESMSPTIRDGDIALVDLRATDLKHDGIYAIRRDGNGDDNEIIVKRVQLLLSKRIRIVSDNEEVAAVEEFPVDQMPDIDVIGRVVWAGGDVR